MRVDDEPLREKSSVLLTSHQLINYTMKLGSATKELRIICNSSINRMGGSLNENLCTGSNTRCEEHFEASGQVMGLGLSN